MSAAAKVLIMLTLVMALSASGHAPARQNEQTDCQLVEKALRKHLELRVGLTRGDVVRYFVPDAGAQFPSSTRYVDPDCKYLHVDVEFDLAKPDQLGPSSDDRIKSVSKLYAEFPTKD